MAILNMVQSEAPFSEWRYSHQHFIFLPRTIDSVDPYYTMPQVFDAPSGYWCRGIREDWDEFAWDHAGTVESPSRSYDLIRCLTYGA